MVQRAAPTSYDQISDDQVLDLFAPATRSWFAGTFDEPTAAQDGAWRAIAQDRHALVVAPTGSGKTLAAFLWSLDRIMADPEAGHRCRVVYVSPLKALAADVERNLRSPLAGIQRAAERLGTPVRPVSVAMRTGDTPANERRRFATHPADILITTPESLFLVLTSAARAGLLGTQAVIVDEIHAVAGTKRGAHLAVTLERLDAWLEDNGHRPAQRIGLSATVRPVDAVAGFLTGSRSVPDGGRPVSIVQPPSNKRWEIGIVVPVADLTDLSAGTEPARNGEQVPSAERVPSAEDPDAPAPDPVRRTSVWPHVEEHIVDLVAEHRSTLVFTNSRRGAERLTARMNELWVQRTEDAEPGTQPPGPRPYSATRAPVGVARTAAMNPGQSGSTLGVAPVIARAHHGSMSRTERTHTESELKEGRLPAVVATSSLELGIDMGAVDLVVQVGAPPSVASGLQRIGRAGHQVGAVSRGMVFPLHRGDLIPAAVIAGRMLDGHIEQLSVVTNPLDILAQQIVAMVALESWTVEHIAEVVRRSAPFAHLSDAALSAVLDMLAGRYPSEDFGELRARVVWDRTTNTITGRPGALHLAVTSGGTIPDRGLFGVFLATAEQSGTRAGRGSNLSGARAPRGGKRVGELDEEMVYESRVGDLFTLGSSTWRIEDITHDRVLVSPAPGAPGRLPFWKGDSPGRPAELGKAMGAWVRELDALAAKSPDQARARVADAGLNPWAADNLLAYLAEQRSATGRVPDDRTIVLERFRDELGDWRIVLHSPYGARVHAGWALVIGARVRDRFGMDGSVMHSDDGIIVRLPDTGWSEDALDWSRRANPPEPTSESPGLEASDLVLEPDEVLASVQRELGGSVMFAARFREAAARALLLPRRRPDRRQPLWQQRQRSAQLLSVAAQYPQFPIVLEAARECLQDNFDVAALTNLMREIAAGQVRLVEVTTAAPSPFAQSLLMGYTAQFLYDDDAPLAEQRAAALSLDPALLAELLGSTGVATELADLLDPDAVRRTETEVAGLAENRLVKHAEGVWDVIRRHGPLPLDAVAARVEPDHREEVQAWLAELEAARRIMRIRLAGATADQDGDTHEQFAVPEDAARLRDGLGVALPGGIAQAYLEPVRDPLGDLIRRHARTHGPFTAHEVAARFGLGVAVVLGVLEQLASAGLVVHGRIRPEVLGGRGDDWCDADVLRTLRRRSLAALRADVEPVTPGALGVFLPRWQSVGSLRGTDGVLRVVEQLAGAVIPASALETWVLPSRVVDYSPAMLDELAATGQVIWCGHGTLPGDGLVSVHLADYAHLTLPLPTEPPQQELHKRILDVLDGGGAHYLSQIAALTERNESEVLDALWDLVWSGYVTNDGFAALRARVGPGAHRAKRPAASARPVRGTRLASLSALGMTPTHRGRDMGRWSGLPERELDPTRRAHALARVLLDRHGVVTRAVAPSEGVSGSFRAVYQMLSELENSGAVRRGYFVEHLGGSQFALPGAVDQLRADAAQRSDAKQHDDDYGEAGNAGSRDGDVRHAEQHRGQRQRGAGRTVLLAAADPANPYGAALPWPTGPQPWAPDLPGDDQAAQSPPAARKHRPGRKAGAVVALRDGDLALYVERGAKSLLTFVDGPALTDACQALAQAAQSGKLGRMVIDHINGVPALTALGEQHPVATALRSAGFNPTPRGLRV